MTCMKTGCHAYVTQYGEYIYGDAHEYNGVWLFRIVVHDLTPRSGPIHFTIHEVADWWDRGLHVSSLIATSITNHGYDGLPFEEWKKL